MAPCASSAFLLPPPPPRCPPHPWPFLVATSALRMPGAEGDFLKISVRAVRSHKPSRKATVGPVAPSHLAPCLTRWRREGWHRLGHAVYHLGIRAGPPLRPHLLFQPPLALA